MSLKRCRAYPLRWSRPFFCIFRQRGALSKPLVLCSVIIHVGDAEPRPAQTSAGYGQTSVADQVGLHGPCISRASTREVSGCRKGGGGALRPVVRHARPAAASCDQVGDPSWEMPQLQIGAGSAQRQIGMGVTQQHQTMFQRTLNDETIQRRAYRHSTTPAVQEQSRCCLGARRESENA